MPLTRRWNAVVRPESPITTWPYSPSAPAGKARGIGSALLRAHHASLDSAGMPAYLEASDLLTRRLYLTRGYEDHGLPILLAGGEPMYPMWRKPREPR